MPIRKIKPDQHRLDYKNWFVWRYMDLFEFLNIIENKELFFTSLKSFEDSYESHLTIELKSKLLKELKKYLYR